MSIEARTATDGTAAGRLRPHGSAVDLDGLAGALRLLGAAFLPLVLLTGLVWAAVYGVFRTDPDRTRHVPGWVDLSHTIIRAQLDRLRETEPPSLAFLGDSACLMGIHVPTLRRMLADDRIESFCTIAHVGPVGYAHMIDLLLDRGAAPERLVVALHPISFFGDRSWEWATRLVLADGRMPENDSDRLVAALDYARARWLDPIVSKPMGNPYGLYYGGYPSVAATIRADHGSAADPQRDLMIHSLEEFRRTGNFARRTAFMNFPYVPNAMFNGGLEKLAKAVERLGPARVYLLLTPLSDFAYSAETERAHDETARDIARRLGIPAENILPQEGYVSDDYLSDTAHMNRWGRILYTGALARHLTPKSTREVSIRPAEARGARIPPPHSN